MILRHAAGYAVGKGVPGVLSLVALVVYTRLLSPEEYGSYSITIAAVTVIALFAFQWQRRVVARWLPAEPPDSHRLLGVTAGQFLIVTASVVVVGTCLAVFLPFAIPVELVVLGTALLIANSWLELNLTIAAAQLQPVRYGLILGSKAILALAIGVVLVWWGWGPSGVLLGLIIGCLFGPGLFARGFWYRVTPLRPTRAELADHLSYGLPVAATLGLTWIIDSSDRFIIALLDGLESAGKYAAGYDLANFSLIALMMIVQLPVQSIVLKSLEDEGEASARRSLASGAELIFGLAIAGASGLIALANPLAEVVVGESYREAVQRVLPVIAIGALLASLKAFYFDLAFVIGKSSTGMMVSSGIAAVLNLALNFLLIPRFGILGAAWSTVAAFGAGLIVSVRLGKEFFTLPSVGGPLAKAVTVGAGILLVTYPLRLLELSAMGHLVTGSAIGALVCGLTALLLDLAGSRSAARAMFAKGRLR